MLHRGLTALLTIGKLGVSLDQLEYYERQVAQGIEDYFSGRGEAPGRWVGGGCGRIGVGDQVGRDAFMRAMAGCDPSTGVPLRPSHARTKVAALDLTFSAPKSVSVLFAVADEETSAAVLEAHELAVEAAFAYAEREHASPLAAMRAPLRRYGAASPPKKQRIVPRRRNASPRPVY